MASDDVKPTRLQAADAALTEFVKKLPSNYRAAVLVFAYRVAVRVAPTYDRNADRQRLPTKTQLEGTALGDAVSTAVTSPRRPSARASPGAPHPPASILLVSDGGQNAGPLKPAAREAGAKAAIPISTVSLGTPGAPSARGPVHRQGVSRANPSCRRSRSSRRRYGHVAKASGGRYYAAQSVRTARPASTRTSARLVYTKQYREITVGRRRRRGVILAGALLSALWFRRLV